MLAHKYVMKLGSNVFASLVSFISLMVMTRYVSDEYGVMMWAWAFVAVFNAVTDMGFNLTNVKFVSEGRDQDRCFSTFLTIKIVMGAVMAALSLASAYVSYVLTHSMDGEAFLVVLIFVVYYLVWDLQQSMTYTFDGRGENGKSSIILAVEFLVRASALAVLAFLQVSTPVLATGYVLGILVSLAACVYMFRHSRVRLCRPEYLRDYLTFTAPIAVSMLLVTAVEYLDKVIIGFSFDGTEVGYYTAAGGVIWTFSNLGKSLNTVILPKLSEYRGKGGDNSELQGMIWKTERYLSLLIFPVMVVILLFGSEIAAVLFGPGYERSGEVMSVQCMVLYSVVITALMTQVLYSTNNARVYGRCSALYIVVVLVCFLTLIPTYAFGLGAVGAGLSMSIGYLVQAIALVLSVRRYARVRFYSRLWRHILAALVDAAVLLAIDHFLDVSGFLPLVIISLFCLVMHFGVCALFRELSREDIAFFRDALDPRKLSSSMREEMHRRSRQRAWVCVGRRCYLNKRRSIACAWQPTKYALPAGRG